MSESTLPLSDVIRALRAEIVAGSIAAENEIVRFELGPIDVELSVVAQREGGPNGKITFGVFGMGAELGGNAKFASEQTQKIKLNLKPVRLLADGSYGELMINKAPVRESKAPAEEPLIRKP